MGIYLFIKYENLQKCAQENVGLKGSRALKNLKYYEALNFYLHSKII